jgi:hypothetical protein
VAAAGACADLETRVGSRSLVFARWQNIVVYLYAPNRLEPQRRPRHLSCRACRRWHLGRTCAPSAPVNSDAAEWFPRPAKDGWLYFGSRRPGGRGKDDIWRARERDGRWVVQNLGAEINTADNESEFQPAPDGRWGLLSTDQGLVRVVATAHGWRRERPFADQNGAEIGPLISPDSQSFIFSRDAGDGASGELFISRPAAGVGWVPRCPAR